MQTKTYFANSVPAAMEAASRELGADAMLLMSKPSAEEFRELGRLEVTFGYEPTEKPERRGLQFGRTDLSRDEADTPSRTLDDIREELAALRAAIDTGGGCRNSTAANSNSGPFDNDARIRIAAGRLAACGLSHAFSLDLVQSAAPRSSLNMSAIAPVMESRILKAAPPEVSSETLPVMAFVGPPGRGKTTSLIKIAMRVGLFARVPVKIYSAGVHAIGGREQIARYAAILGVPQIAIESYHGLSLALKAESWRGLALIDTPGMSPSDEEEAGGLTNFLLGRSGIETHLVLRADAGIDESLAMIDRFRPMNPTRLLITGLDEISRVGPLVEILCRSGLPATWVGTGSRIPGDLELLDAASLVGRLQREHRPAKPGDGAISHKAAA